MTSASETSKDNDDEHVVWSKHKNAAGQDDNDNSNDSDDDHGQVMQVESTSAVVDRLGLSDKWTEGYMNDT